MAFLTYTGPVATATWWLVREGSKQQVATVADLNALKALGIEDRGAGTGAALAYFPTVTAAPPVDYTAVITAAVKAAVASAPAVDVAAVSAAVAANLAARLAA
jgi:hypothetical protein